MKSSTTQTHLQVQVRTFAAELKDLLSDLREAESVVEFELALEALEMMVKKLEWVGP